MFRLINPKSQVIVSEIDHKALHSFIINKISTEFSNMNESCYYPKISEIFRDLLHMTHSKEKELLEYSKLKYRGYEKMKLLHDPFTTLLIIIVQEFLRNKDLAAAEAAFHLFALRTYTNSLHKMTTPRGSRKSFCNPNAWNCAFENLSRNHLFIKQKTIPNSVLYYSRAVFQIHLKNLKEDNSDGLFDMIYALKSRIMQSMRSFFEKYYECVEEDKMSKTEKEGRGEYDPSHETKLRGFIIKIVNDICIYGKTDQSAINEASSLLKFNKKFSEEYAKQLANPRFSEQLESTLYLLLKDIKDISIIKNVKFLDYVQKLMSIKVTKHPVYFKKFISEIHLEIIKILNLSKWYNNLSIQSQSVSRNFIAYYLAFYLKGYI